MSTAENIIDRHPRIARFIKRIRKAPVNYDLREEYGCISVTLRLQVRTATTLDLLESEESMQEAIAEQVLTTTIEGMKAELYKLEFEVLGKLSTPLIRVSDELVSYVRHEVEKRIEAQNKKEQRYAG